MRLDVPYVATNGVAYATRDDARLCDVLTCVKYATSLQNAGTLLRPNHEHDLKPPAQMARLFAEFPLAIANTLAIAEQCTFRLDKLHGEFPLFRSPKTRRRRSRTCARSSIEGARERYAQPFDPEGRAPARVRARDHRAHGPRRLLSGGVGHRERGARGSACSRKAAARRRTRRSATRSGSPRSIRSPGGLLFERFLSEERGEIPDIDIDFAHQDREKVIQYVYERYGREHAAMAAEVITYRTRSAIRDVGKALGLTLGQVDAIVREYDARESLSGALGVEHAPTPTFPTRLRSGAISTRASNVYRSREDDAPAATPGRTLVPGFHDADEYALTHAIRTRVCAVRSAAIWARCCSPSAAGSTASRATWASTAAGW